MTLALLLIIPFIAGLALRLLGRQEKVAWFVSSLVLPALVLFDEFVLPYRGGGASMWPIAIVFGGFYGTISGGLGVLAAKLYLKKRDNSQHSARPGG
jgi:hypothetical protein